jgi:ArsR family transcriptional regulator, arsenate/arsenite/antimonite-responsive transcriptional repressor
MSRPLIQLEQQFKALADATRLRILGLLLGGEICVCHIHESLRISQPKASRHLAYLRRAGLVATRREGLWIYYRLADVTDPLMLTIRQAVTHALGHVEAIHRDTQRLEKKTGCCVPPARTAPAYACCEGAASPRRIDTSTV